ncbi:uncharacterized protein LOC120077241 [Benincasa hispida]|uniref:uncharacterized protein LOC120077241 n=1 Tax=Benincasa hispida TaxID=102211 RepID=UPI0019016C7B|nr:uncharacterized protein LOC120077241 [Benincasa hispida]
MGISSAISMERNSPVWEKRELRPRYIEPYEIVERVGSTAYRLQLSMEVARIHDIFHVSMLRKYMPDPIHILATRPVQLKKDLSYEEEAIKILDRKDQVFRIKTIPLVKVLWRNRGIEEATWEPEKQMRKRYPQLFK